MPAKSGASHASAAFLSIVLGALISNVLSAHAGLLGDTVEGVGSLVATIPGLSLSEDVTGLLVVSTLLAFLWGVAYHYSQHSGRSSRKNYMSSEQFSEQSAQMSAGVNGLPDIESGETGSRDHLYRSVDAAQQAEQQLRSRLQRDLDDLKSRLDDIHDRRYDANDTEAAQRVSELVESVTGIERTLGATRSEPFGGDSRLSDRRRQSLVETHDRLVETSDELLAAVRHVHHTGETGPEFFTTCNQSLTELEQAVTDRRDAIRNTGDIQ
jgi:hypothetical protein